MDSQVKQGYKQTELGLIPEDWELQTLGKIADILMGQSPAGNTYNKLGIGVPLINGPTEFTKISPIKVQWTSQPTKICKKNDLLICVRGSSTGRINIANDEYCIGRGVAAIRAKPQSDTKYLTNQIILGIESILSLSAGSTFPNIDGKSIRSIVIPLPPTIAEQEKIAEALSDVDSLIESLEELIAKKRNIKQGAMQELLTGKRRLSGFEQNADYKQTELGLIPEDWNIFQLGEIVNYVKGFAFKTSDYCDDGIRILRVSDTTSEGVKYDSFIYLDPKRFSSFKKWSLNFCDLIISTVGSKPPMYDSIVGKATLITYKEVGNLLNQNAVILRNNKKQVSLQIILHNHFRQSRYLNYIEQVFRGNANQASITLKELFQFPIPLPPTKAEQEAISEVLTDMDNEITALEEKLQKTRHLKQGMMQELLTGKTRLI